MMHSRTVLAFAGFAMAAMVLPLAGQAPARPTRATIKPLQQQTPFTAEFKITTVRTLANGSTISSERMQLRAVDSSGRQMTETVSTLPSGEERKTTVVLDPVAGTHITWDSEHTQALISDLHPQRSADRACAPAAQAAPTMRRTSTTENLGVDTIEGLEAHGSRTTVTTPAGMIGNSEPLVGTHEAWIATSIKPYTLILRQIDDDPQSGRTTTEVTRVSLGEPDEAIFQPPQGYDTVNRAVTAPSCPAAKTAAAPAEQPQ